MNNNELLNMEKLCLIDCKIDGIIFCKGMCYKVEWNPVDNHFYAYTIWGYVQLNNFEYKNIFA